MGTKIGVIGVGTISTAIVKGFNKDGLSENEFVLCPFDLEKAKVLTDKFSNVTVATSNQDVLDKSEWVIIAIIPSIGREVLTDLKFREDHRVINLMTDHKLEDVAAMIGKTKVLVRMVPLPFIVHRIGPIVVYPPSPDTEQLFSPLGDIVSVESEKAMETMSVTTALMSPFYQLMNDVIKWGIKEGLTTEQAVQYSASFFSALLFMIKGRDVDGINKLVNDMTPGGINEMALMLIREVGGFDLWPESLDKVMDRIKERRNSKA